MAVTRIQNNQITDATIVAYAKLQAGSLTGNLFAPSVTLNSNVTINGNLFLANTGNVTTINATNTYINDPLVMFNNGYTGSLTGYDIGILVNRNLASLGSYGSVNTFLGWVEADSAFETLATTDTGTGVTSINNSGYANFKTGNATLVSGTVTGTLGVTGATTLTTATVGGLQAVAIGNATPGTGAFTTLSTTGNLTVGGNIAITGNIVPSANVVYSLGTLNSRFKDIFLSGSTIYAGGFVISEETSGNLNLTANNGNRLQILGTAANVIQATGNIVAPFHLGSLVGASATITTSANITGTGASTNSTSGALVVMGGAGVAGQIYAGGIQNTPIGGTTASTATFTTATTGGLQAVAIGNVTPGSGAFTTGTFSSTLGVTGATTMTTATTGGLQAVAIGNATPGSGAFTTGTFSSTLGVTGATTMTTATTGGLQAVAIGNVTPGSGAFTTAAITSTTNATSITTGALTVAGGASIQQDLWIGGNIYANALNTVTTVQLQVNQPLLYLASNASPYTFDIGFYGHFVGGPANRYGHTGFVRDYNTNQWVLFSNVPSEPTANVVNLSDSNLLYDTLKSGGLILANATAASSTTTGALQVTGGAGIVGSAYIGGGVQNTIIGNATASTAFFTTATATTVNAATIGNIGANHVGTGTYLTSLTATNVNGTVATANVSMYDNITPYTTNQTFYLQFANVTNGNTNSGAVTTVNVNPSTGTLSATTFSGAISSGMVTTALGFTPYNATNPAGYQTSSGSVNSATYATQASSVNINSTTSSSTYYPVFTDSTTTGALNEYMDGNGLLKYTPSTGNLTTANIMTTWGANINTGQNAGAAASLYVSGKRDATLIWARPNATYDAVIMGNSATNATVVNGAKLQINTTDSILLPVGTNAQRPTASGLGTDTTGMFRYSTTAGGVEWYTGSAWVAATTSFTVIADQQFSGTGSQTAFTLSEAQTTNSCIVSINGVVQIPTLAYSVTSTTLTFTEAPANGEVIDVRKLTTTSTVTGLSDTSGYITIDVTTGTGIVFSSASTSGVGSRYIIEPVNGAMVTTIANVTVSSAGTSVIDNLWANTYSSAKYTITATMSGTNIREINEVLLVHNGSGASAGTVTVLSYGKINTAGNTLVTFGGTATGNIAQLQATTTNANTIFRIKRDYQAL